MILTPRFNRCQKIFWRWDYTRCLLAIRRTFSPSYSKSYLFNSEIWSFPYLIISSFYSFWRIHHLDQKLWNVLLRRHTFRRDAWMHGLSYSPLLGDCSKTQSIFQTPTSCQSNMLDQQNIGASLHMEISFLIIQQPFAKKYPGTYLSGTL